MGFQGTDPATDFRGMGLLGLDNLIYIAENHSLIFRRIVKEQSSRDDNDYPVAVTGISITQLLFTLLKLGEDKQEDNFVYNILFDHDFAFEEIYSVVFQLLDRTWDEMNAAYMDFPRVLNAGLFSFSLPFYFPSPSLHSSFLFPFSVPLISPLPLPNLSLRLFLCF